MRRVSLVVRSPPLGRQVIVIARTAPVKSSRTIYISMTRLGRPVGSIALILHLPWSSPTCNRRGILKPVGRH